MSSCVPARVMVRPERDEVEGDGGEGVGVGDGLTQRVRARVVVVGDDEGQIRFDCPDVRGGRAVAIAIDRPGDPALVGEVGGGDRVVDDRAAGQWRHGQSRPAVGAEGRELGVNRRECAAPDQHPVGGELRLDRSVFPDQVPARIGDRSGIEVVVVPQGACPHGWRRGWCFAARH